MVLKAKEPTKGRSLYIVYCLFYYIHIYPDISGQQVYESNGFEQWIVQLKSFVEKQLGISCKKLGYNHRSVQFVIDRGGIPLEVDLLLSPYWSSPFEFYSFLVTVQIKQRKMCKMSHFMQQVLT